jgi:glycosyltransferase involved in cell wall biosynthesis
VRLRHGIDILRSDGPLVFGHRARRYAQRRLARGREVELPVALEDVLAADWDVRQANDGRVPVTADRPLTITWVIPPIGNGSGGHHTILRFVRALEQRGHRCRIVVYDGRGIQTGAEAREILARHFPPMRATVSSDRADLLDADALIATAWQTAYPVFAAATTATKLYFVQDFEPSFHPVGTEAVLAESTYRFGLTGITAGRWLSEKLAAEYGMPCGAFEFGSDPGRYALTNHGPRRKVVFYARPGASRRGFELGVFALTLFHRRNPDCPIHFVGSTDAAAYRLPFPVVHEGILTAERLNALYNESAAALVMSLTNMSLLPLELLSAGCVPVVNDGPNNRLVSDNPYIAYAPPAPQALARRLDEAVNRPDLPAHAAAASASVQALSWDDAADTVEELLRAAVSAGAPLAAHGA